LFSFTAALFQELRATCLQFLLLCTCNQ